MLNLWLVSSFPVKVVLKNIKLQVNHGEYTETETHCMCSSGDPEVSKETHTQQSEDIWNI